MDRVSSLLPAVLHRRGLHQHAVTAQALGTLRTWFINKAPALADAVTFVRIQQGEVHVHARHGVAVQEASELREELLAYARQAFPSLSIVRVRITRE